MGTEQPHKAVKLVIPVLLSDENIFQKIRCVLLEKFGPIDYVSEMFEFNFTNYYNEEMQTPIFRLFLSFFKLIQPEDLAGIKKFTNFLESSSALEGRRKVNLDPGYLELGKFILSTTKDQQHRIYISNGIYEEVTLFFRAGEWNHYEWTYPDYRSDRYKNILINIRKIYQDQIYGKITTPLE